VENNHAGLFLPFCTSIALTMAEVRALEKRNVVVVGKTGAGKSTVANKILGLEKFAVKNVAPSVTLKVEAHCCDLDDESSPSRYNLKVIDTVGLFDTNVKNDAAIKKMKNFFQNECPEGVNLVLFVCRKGRFTEEERRTFDYIMKHLRKQISDFSALVFTHCDGQSDSANQEFLISFEKEASDIVSFMKKGICMVGFPHLSNLRPQMKEVIQEEMKEQTQRLLKIVMKADKRCLGNEMFEPTFWEKLRQCSIL